MYTIISYQVCAVFLRFASPLVNQARQGEVCPSLSL